MGRMNFLTITTLWADSTVGKLEIHVFVLFFPENRIWHEMSNPVF